MKTCKRITSLCLYHGLLLGAALCMWASVAVGDLNDGLVLYYSFTTNGGSVVQDQSGSNNNATVQGATWITNGAVGGAYYFDGVDDYLSVPGSGSLNELPVIDHSTCAWVKFRTFRFTESDPYDVLFFKCADGDSSQGGVLVQFAFSAGTNYLVEALPSSTPTYTTSYAYCPLGALYTEQKTDTWYHVACVHSRSENKEYVYLNGTLKGTMDHGDHVPKASAHAMGIGRKSSTQNMNQLNGTVDELRIYNRMLTAQEVGQLFEARLNPVLHYTFDGNDGTNVMDQSGNGYTGIVFGATWVSGGISGGALNFDGVNDYVTFDRLAAHSFSQFGTISLWAKWTNSVVGANQPVLVSGQDTNCFDRFVLKVSETGGIDADNAIGTTVGSGLNDGKWHHIASVYDDVNHKVQTYIDGQYAGQETRGDSFFLNLNAGRYSIGQKWVPGPAAGQFWQGEIDDVQIYDVALSSDRILQLYKEFAGFRFEVAGSPSNIGTPVAYGYGTNYVLAGETVTNTVATPVSGGTGVRYTCTGWTGSGDVPGSGPSNRVVFTATTNSTLTWNWTPEYYLTVSSGGYGGVDVSSGWYTNGAVVTLTATGQTGCTFWRWSGDVPPGCSANNPLVVTMDQARSITAMFNAGPNLGMVLYYPFTTNGGSVVQDQSGSNNNATVQGATWITNGAVGGACYFDGVDDYLSVPGSPSLNELPVIDHTICAWVKFRTFRYSVPDPYDVLFFKCADGDSSQGGILVQFDISGGTIYLDEALPSSTPTYTPSYAVCPLGVMYTEINTDTWYHVACVYSRSENKEYVYLNGTLKGTMGHGDHVPKASSHAMGIGRKSSTQNMNQLNGTIDELRIYNRMLTAQDVLDVYSQEGGAVGYVQLVVAGIPSWHGVPAPYDYGTNQVASNSTVTVSVSSPADVTSTQRWVCAGWTGDGSVPASGGSNQASFTITTNSVLTWNWQKQYLLQVAAGAHGNVSQTGGWYNASSVQGVTANASNGYHFAGWTGDVAGGHELDNPLSLTMDRARSVTATFGVDTYSISGKVYYWGDQEGTIRVEVMDKAVGGNLAGQTQLAQPGSYTVTGLGAHGDYWVRAYVDEDGDGAYDSWEPMGECSRNPVTNVMGSVTGLDIQIRRLSAPKNVTAQGEVGGIDVGWEASSDTGVDGYNVYRFDPNWGRFDLLTAAPVGGLGYADGTAEAGVKYWYFVTAVSYSGLMGSYMQSPASDLVSASWGQIALWMPDYFGNTGEVVRLRINVEDAAGLLGTEMKIRVTYDAGLLTPVSELGTNQTVEKTVLTKDMEISTVITNGTVEIWASNAVANHATLRILGCSYESAPKHPIVIRGKCRRAVDVDWMAINGYQNVNDGQVYSMDMGVVSRATNVILAVREEEWGQERQTDEGSEYVKVFWGGQVVNVAGVTNRECLKSFVRPYVDTNLTVMLATNEVLYFIEMGTETNGASADWQDVVGLVEYNRGMGLKGSGHLFDVLFKVTNSAAAGAAQTNAFDYVLLKDQKGDALTVDSSDVAVLTVTNRWRLGDVDGDGSVTVEGDFMLALQIAVGAVTPNERQVLAGDINGDGAITKLDATLIRRIALGLPVNENGGVVGGLGMCGEGGVSAEGLTGEGYVVSVGSGEGEPGGVVRVPLMVDRTNGIASVEVRVTYNAYLLTLESVTNGPVSGAYGFAYHGGTGYVDIVMSAAEGITASNGIVAYLDFRVKGSAGVGTMSELTITRNDLGDAYGGEFEWRTGVGASNGWVWVVMGTGDSDGDGLTDYEEQHYDGSALYDPGGADTDALNPDTDGDGMKDGDEVRAGTDPLKAESMLEIESLRAISGNGLVIQWQSVAGKRYTINWTTNLLNGFEALKTNIIGIAPDNVYTDTYNGTGPCYYRIKLEK